MPANHPPPPNHPPPHHPIDDIHRLAQTIAGFDDQRYIDFQAAQLLQEARLRWPVLYRMGLLGDYRQQ